MARLIILLSAAGTPLGLRAASPALHWLAPVGSLLAAAAYSLLAGFSLPTQRALIAVAVVVAKLCFRRIQPFVCLVWALTLIALLQPLAVLSAGIGYHLPQWPY